MLIQLSERYKLKKMNERLKLVKILLKNDL